MRNSYFLQTTSIQECKVSASDLHDVVFQKWKKIRADASQIPKQPKNTWQVVCIFKNTSSDFYTL